jgi:hypothetical protein
VRKAAAERGLKLGFFGETKQLQRFWLRQNDDAVLLRAE